MMIKTNRPAIAGTKYVSTIVAGIVVGVVVGVVVAVGASFTPAYVSGLKRSHSFR
jgi:F0F1-type ATP synthase assembly protein I